MSGPHFGTRFQASLLELFSWRRDVRRFNSEDVSTPTLERLIRVASLSPSVGLSEPWRFVIVDDGSRRHAIRSLFESCNADALSRQPNDRAGLYARLKLEGLRGAPRQFAVFADTTTNQGHGLGRATMPASTVEYSAVMALHTLWLAARAEGIGLGWVSILDPTAVASALEVPPEWTFIGYFCLGYPSETSLIPELEQEQWEIRRDPSSTVVRR